jgi:hypothetical protein
MSLSTAEYLLAAGWTMLRDRAGRRPVTLASGHFGPEWSLTSDHSAEN